ncbi:MAG: hypothetical protein RL173_1576 [Fibrobacterota bacterium]|jgi:hypothetical protein
MLQPLDYHAHHPAFGSYGSFTLGAIGEGGGFNVHDGRQPASEEVYVGFGRASEGLRLLPFSKVSHADLSAFATTGPSADLSACRTLPPHDISRQLGWGTDSWSVDGFRLTLATPFGPTADPRREGWEALGNALLPAIWGELEFDNSRSTEDAVVVFGIGQGDTGVAPLELPGIVGACRQGRVGIASLATSGARPFCGFSLESALGVGLSGRVPHWLGSTFGLVWTVAAGTVGKCPMVLGWYHHGLATTGLDTTYGYTHVWNDLDAVLDAALAHSPEAWKTARDRDRELEASAISDDRKWMLAHATRGYLGNLQILSTPEGAPVCVVNEGEYCMMNTLDLSVDQAFFEAKFFPWITREILDLFADRHSFIDELKLPDETRIHQGGLSFCHDMGVRNRFSPSGHSSYEMPDLEGCFSHMTFEQACNWPLTGAVHLAGSMDKNWCIGRRTTLEGILESLERREHPDATRRSGVPGTDSVRCGSGTEITTYDSLDPSLAQTRQNLYTTVKLWAAYLALEKLLSAAECDSLAARAREGAKRSAKAVVEWPERNGIMPAISDGRNASTILPAVEGLVYPLFWNDRDAVSANGPFGPMVSKLGRHLGRALDDGICRFPDGGWRISSTSDNSWLSKIWIAQTVAERVYGRMPDSVADRAHAGWLSPGSSRWGWSDQIVGGQAIGSKFYPRGVTSILFLLEP